jgi:serine/threonine protein kinase
MRKGKIIFILLAILAVTAGGLVRNQLNRQVLLLKNGKVIPVDRVWESGTDLFYENDQEIRFINQAEIESLENQSISQLLKAAGAKSARIIAGCAKGLDPLFNACSSLRRQADRSLWLIIASLTLPVILLYGIRLVRSRPDVRRARVRPSKRHNALPSTAPKTLVVPELPNRVDLVRFFLNLYRNQLGAGLEAPADFVQLPAVPSSPNLVYELRVKSGGDWVKRRMTIGPLGEDSGSRSKCYYVIFDQHLVVKVPPKPITDFEDYITGIKKQGYILERLAPKECIVPRVSVILSQVRQLPSLMGLPEELVEEQYIDWLRKNTGHQEQLKINGTFIFFMDLSRYYFLGHIIDGLHDQASAIHAEIISTPELIRYPERFKERYQEMNEAVGFEIRDLFHQCEAEVRKLLTNSGQSSAVAAYHIQDWFIRYLEKRDIGEIDSGLSADLAGSVRTIFKKLFGKYESSVEAYLSAVKSFARRLSLEQNRLIMSGILSNLLDLLAWLSEQQVAMRDLKPDNLLVAGDPQHYPAFLRSAADYSLGFIDVETAVYLGQGEAIKQPLLGGTPYYATPSHLFPNTALESCFPDTTRILHLQDWQAVMVMIFKIVTGELLFDGAAQHFGDIKIRVLNAMRHKAPLKSELQDVSRTFWRSAAAEFRAKIKARETALSLVVADIPKNARALFAGVLQGDIEAIAGSIQGMVESHAHLLTLSSRARLLNASHSRLCQMLEELPASDPAARASSQSIRSTRELLQNLAALKALSEHKGELLSALSQVPCRMSAYEVLILMFDSVMRAMNPDDWKAPAKDPAGQTCGQVTSRPGTPRFEARKPTGRKGQAAETL